MLTQLKNMLDIVSAVLQYIIHVVIYWNLNLHCFLRQTVLNMIQWMIVNGWTLIICNGEVVFIREVLLYMEAINVQTLYFCMDHNLYGSSLFLRDTECMLEVNSHNLIFLWWVLDLTPISTIFELHSEGQIY